MTTYFIHVSKTGGSTIEYYLKQYKKVNIVTHVKQAKFDTKGRYYISLRNPVDRFISAFYYCLTEPDHAAWAPAIEFYQKYNNSLEFLCENIYNTNGELNNETVHDLKKVYHDELKIPLHLGMDINWYIGDIVEQLTHDNVLGIICTETLNKDMKQLFNMDVQQKIRKNKNKKPLEKKYRDILKRYLYKDYKCIQSLYDSQIISTEQYNILST